jgi:DNA-directed RNA polymerase subunit RPC12/RpoP
MGRSPVILGQNTEAYACAFCGARFIFRGQWANSWPGSCPECDSISIARLRPQKADRHLVFYRLAINADCEQENIKLIIVRVDEEPPEGFSWF